MQTIKLVVCLITLMLLCIIPSYAQETRGMISGTVTDPTSAAVAGATVTVTNVGTNVSTRLTTNASGYYEAPLLVAGEYQIAVEAPGFKRFVRSGLTLVMSGRLNIDLALEMGALSESVTVSAEAPMLDTTAVATGRVVSQRELSDLPVMTNNVVMLARSAPGVEVQHTTQYLGQGMVGGSSSFTTALGIGQNQWSIDGAPNSRGGGIAFTPFTDLVSEYKVETSNFDASFGHSIGLNVQFASRSGTNDPHGTITEQYWNLRWNANPFFVKQNYYRQIAEARAAGDTARADELAKQPMRAGGHSNNYGATLGGPVYIPKVFDGRNRLFFFFGFSGSNDRQPARSGEMNRTVPTMAHRDGNFSDLLAIDPARYQIYDPLSVQPDPNRPTQYIRTPFPGNIIPKSRIINPSYDFFTSRLPKPNNDPLSANLEPTNNYLALSMPDNTDYKSYSNRIDYQHSDKHRFFFRWNWSLFYEDAQDWTYETERGFRSWDEYRKSVSGVFDWAYVATPATVINVNVASNLWWQRQFHDTYMSYKPSDAGLPAYLDEKCASSIGCGAPRMLWEGYSDIGWPIASWPRTRSQSLKINISHIRGNHTIRAGTDFRQHIRTDPGAGGNTGGQYYFRNTFTRKDSDGLAPAGNLGLSWAAYMLGIPSEVNIDTNASYALMNPYYAWYLQDTWRITRNLTVTAGLRIEYEQGPTERYNRAMTQFNPDATLAIANAAAAAYASNPIPELPVSAFSVKGGAQYVGSNGGARRIWPNELMFLPRLSAAWQFDPRTVLRGGYGVYFDSINVQQFGVNQYGFSRATNSSISTDFGNTWLLGDPQNGVSPLANPFPVRADGTRFDTPLGNALGANAVLGQTFNDRAFLKHTRMQRWRIGVQRQLGSNMVIEAAYWGQFADRVEYNRTINPLPEQFWATGMVRNNTIATEMNRNVANPFHISNLAELQTTDPVLYAHLSNLDFFKSATIRKHQLLRIFPHMSSATGGGLNSRQYDGKARSHSLEITFERRFSKGFNVNAAYTRAMGEAMTTLNNEFDASPIWLPSNSPRPHRFTASGIYEFPFGKGRRFLNSGIGSFIVGGWQTALTYEFQPGPFLTWDNYFYYGDMKTLSQELTKGTKSFDRWFNTDIPIEKVSSRNPAAFHVRVFPRDITSVRGDGVNLWNANLRRDFNMSERVRLEIRLDALNLTNRSQFENPSTDPRSTDFGRITSQTSSVNRFYQIQGRIRF